MEQEHSDTHTTMLSLFVTYVLNFYQKLHSQICVYFKRIVSMGVKDMLIEYKVGQRKITLILTRGARRLKVLTIEMSGQDRCSNIPTGTNCVPLMTDIRF